MHAERPVKKPCRFLTGGLSNTSREKREVYFTECPLCGGRIRLGVDAAE